MARCRNCLKTVKNPSAKNFQKHQLCYQCANKLHPKDYIKQKYHGVGYKYPKTIKFKQFGRFEENSIIINN